MMDDDDKLLTLELRLVLVALRSSSFLVAGALEASVVPRHVEALSA